MSVTSARYRETSVAHFRRVLAAWLGELPTDGWEGGVAALGDELWAVASSDPVPTFVPRRNGLGRRIAAEVPFIEASGFAVEFRRTKRQRTLRFVRT